MDFGADVMPTRSFSQDNIMTLDDGTLVFALASVGRKIEVP